MSDPTGPTGTPGGARLRALVVDDEPPALEELAWLLRQDDRIGAVLTATSGAEALRVLEHEEVDVVFLDIRMPGLDGLDLARVLARFLRRPQVVFVSAYEDHAVDAFELQAIDYVLKPVRAERLAEAVRRAAGAAAGRPAATDVSAEGAPEEPPDETIAVELGGVTRFIQRSEVHFVEAHGDYARLYTETGTHLVRVPLATLEERWAPAGFVRIHRRHLVAVAHVDEVRFDSGRLTVRLGERELTVSRRHNRQLRDLLVRRARPGRDAADPR